MRSTVILAMFGTLLLQPAGNSADANAQCQSSCASEKASRDVNCPPLNEDGQARSQWLWESREFE
jgi:hypothetical protein